MNIMPIAEQSLTGASLWAVANSKKSILTGVSGAGKWRIGRRHTRFEAIPNTAADQASRSTRLLHV
ncbi:hypothetical protein [Xanthomonas sp. NCPPB 1754]